jgi:Glycosyltransferase family 10 (fucosyltransferase) C-term
VLKNMLFKPTCFTSSSIGPCPTLCDNFLAREQTTSITWDDGWNFQDDSWFRTFHCCEPLEVFPNVAKRLIEVHKFYDLILAFDENVLRECKNAVFLTESACSWLPRKWNAIDPLGSMRYENGVIHKNPVVMSYESCDVSSKEFSVSFLTSAKRQFPGHILRQDIYECLPERIGELRVWKHRSPPIINDKRTVLEPYQFSIVPENSRQSGYYTEKIVDCFIAKTIPVYWGCTDIAKHFNADGIVQFENCNDLLDKLKRLTTEFYKSKEAAVEENFHTALRGIHQWDAIENAITLGIEKKLREGDKRIDFLPVQNTRFLRRPFRRAI